MIAPILPITITEPIDGQIPSETAALVAAWLLGIVDDEQTALQSREADR